MMGKCTLKNIFVGLFITILSIKGATASDLKHKTIGEVGYSYIATEYPVTRLSAFKIALSLDESQYINYFEVTVGKSLRVGSDEYFTDGPNYLVDRVMETNVFAGHQFKFSLGPFYFPLSVGAAYAHTKLYSTYTDVNYSTDEHAVLRDVGGFVQTSAAVLVNQKIFGLSGIYLGVEAFSVYTASINQFGISLVAGGIK